MIQRDLNDKIPPKPVFGQSQHLAKAQARSSGGEMKTSRARYEREVAEARAAELRMAELMRDPRIPREKPRRRSPSFLRWMGKWVMVSVVSSLIFNAIAGDKLASILGGVGGGQMTSAMVKTATNFSGGTIRVGDRDIDTKGMTAEEVMELANEEAQRIVKSGDQAAIGRLQSQMKQYEIESKRHNAK